MTRTVHCIKLGKNAEGLENAPVPGELGEKILGNVSKEAWTSWLAHQTMLINEKQLNMMNADDRKYLLSEMDKFLNNEDFDKPEGYVPENE